MKIESVGYPDLIDIPSMNSTEQYFNVLVTGLPSGLRFRATSINVDNGAGFDNITAVVNGGSPVYMQEFNNPDSTLVFDGVSTGNDTIEFAAAGSPDTGNFSFTLEVETGSSTDEYVALTTTVAGIAFDTQGDAYAVASEYDDGEALPTCFWTDTVKVRQYGCEAAATASTVTVQMQIDDVLWWIDPDEHIVPLPEGFAIGTDFLLLDSNESESHNYLWDAGDGRYEAEIVDGAFGAPAGEGCFLRQGETDFPVTIAYNDISE